MKRSFDGWRIKSFHFVRVASFYKDDIKGKYYDSKKSLPPSSIQPAYKKEVFESPSISPPCYCRLFKYSHHILIVHLSCFSNDTHNSSLLQSAFYIHLSMAGKRDGGEYYTRFAIKGNKNEMKKTIF